MAMPRVLDHDPRRALDTSRGAPHARPRVVLVGKCYAALENQKNLDALAAHCDLLALTPSSARTHWERVACARPAEREAYLHPVPPLGHAGLLHPFGSALRAHRPDLINVEADPWSPLTVQTLVLAARHAPTARVVCTVKKNTYLPRRAAREWTKRGLARWARHSATGRRSSRTPVAGRRATDR